MRRRGGLPDGNPEVRMQRVGHKDAGLYRQAGARTLFVLSMYVLFHAAFLG